MTFLEIIYFIIPVFLAFFIMVFLVGATFYISSNDKKESKEKGKKFMAFGILAVSGVLVFLLLLGLL